MAEILPRIASRMLPSGEEIACGAFDTTASPSVEAVEEVAKTGQMIGLRKRYSSFPCGMQR
jgi:hypothetical protein